MYKIVYTNRMKKDTKLMKKRGKDISKLTNVLSLLAAGNPLPMQYKDHSLTGNLQDFRECHIEPDWLLMYHILLFFLQRLLAAMRIYSISNVFAPLAYCIQCILTYMLLLYICFRYMPCRLYCKSNQITPDSLPVLFQNNFSAILPELFEQSTQNILLP